MDRLRRASALCLLGLAACGRTSTPTSNERHKAHPSALPNNNERPVPKRTAPKVAAPPDRHDRESTSSSSALEHFRGDLDTTVEALTPFANGTKDPHEDIDALKKAYERLHPLYAFLSNYLREHRDEISDTTRQAIGKINTSASSLNVVLIAEDSAHPHLLENFINHTLDNIEDIRPVLQDLDAPGDTP